MSLKSEINIVKKEILQKKLIDEKNKEIKININNNKDDI
jgi:hypothetical protein